MSRKGIHILLWLSMSIPVLAMDETTIYHFKKGDLGGMDLSDVGGYQRAHAWSVGNQAYTNTGLELCQGYRAPKLIGDYQLQRFEQPDVSLIIDVSLDDDGFISVATGCLIITHGISFNPTGVVPKEPNEHLSNGNEQNYFIRQILYGGRFLQGNSFKMPKNVNSALQQETIFFANDNAGFEGFKNKLYDVFKNVDGLEIVGLFCSTSPQIRTDTFGAFGPINNEPEAEKNTQSTVGKQSLKNWAKDLFATKKKKKGERCTLLDKQWRAALVRLKDIQCYIQAYAQANPEGNKQISKAAVCSDLMLMQVPAYQKIKLESLSNDLSELQDMIETYTVEIYERLQGPAGHVTCRIDVYPNKRGSFYQVISSAVTWISAEACGESHHAALLEAFFKVQKMLAQRQEE